MVSGGSFLLGGSNKDTRRCFLWCLQASNSSSLLFSIEFWSAVRIKSFSVRHRSHERPPLENGWPLALQDKIAETNCCVYKSEIFCMTTMQTKVWYDIYTYVFNSETFLIFVQLEIKISSTIKNRYFLLFSLHFHSKKLLDV